MNEPKHISKVTSEVLDKLDGEKYATRIACLERALEEMQDNPADSNKYEKAENSFNETLGKIPVDEQQQYLDRYYTIGEDR